MPAVFAASSKVLPLMKIGALVPLVARYALRSSSDDTVTLHAVGESLEALFIEYQEQHGVGLLQLNFDHVFAGALFVDHAVARVVNHDAGFVISPILP